MIHTSAPPHGKFTLAVASVWHPHGLVMVLVVVHCGTKQLLQAVAVAVTVGHCAAGEEEQMSVHVLVVVEMEVTTAVSVTGTDTV